MTDDENFSGELPVWKFAESSLDRIFNGQKNKTWRVPGEYEDVEPGDKVVAANPNGEEEGIVEILWVKKTKFRILTREDKRGHEKFVTDEEMYEQFREFYPESKVGPECEVHVNRFKIVE